jgi:hypothetical protein
MVFDYFTNITVIKLLFYCERNEFASYCNTVSKKLLPLKIDSKKYWHILKSHNFYGFYILVQRKFLKVEKEFCNFVCSWQTRPRCYGDQ